MEGKNSSRRITFRPDATYQISLIASFSKDSVSHLKNKEIKSLISAFKVTSQPNGQFERPHLFIISELNGDIDFLDWSTNKNILFVKSTFLKVQNEVSMTFLPDKRYEFFAAWLKQGKSHLLQEFFVASEPIKQSYGRPAPVIKVQFEPVSKAIGPSYFEPHMAGLVEWDKDSDVKKLLGHPEFATKAAPLMQSAIERMEMVLGQLV